MQSVSAGFETAVKAPGRRITDYVEVSWDGTGAVTGARGASGWIDESANLRSHTGMLRINAPIGDLIAPGDIGTCTVTLWNSSGRYAAKRADSPLAEFIGGPTGLSGKLVRVWVGVYVSGSPEYVCVFTGVVQSWKEAPGNATVDLVCKDIGYLWLQNKQDSAVSSHQRADAWINQIADLAGIAAAPSGRVIDPGIFSIPYCWLADESLVEEIWETARADNGLAWFDQLGRLRFENTLHWATHSLVWTFDQSDFSMPDPVASMEDVATDIVTEWSARKMGAPTEVYHLDQEKVIRPGKSLTWEARYSWPVTELLPLRFNDHDMDYWLVTSAGVDLNSQCTISLANKYAQKCDVTITNNNATHAAHLVYLSIRGRPLIGGPTEQVTKTADPAPYAFKRERSVRGNLYVQTKSQAQAFVGFLADKHKRVRPVITLRAAAGIPHLELGDRVAYADSRGLGLNSGNPKTAQGYIVGMNWTSSNDVGFRQDLQLLDLTDLWPYSDYFIIGTTALGAHGRCWY